MAGNQSTARNYEQAPKEQRKSKLQVVKGTQKKPALTIAPRTILVFLAFVAAFCFMLYYQSLITEVTSDINNLNRQMKVLESENVRLAGALEYTESPRLIAERAENELGMHKIDDFSIIYVDIYEGDTIEVAKVKKPEGVSEQVQAAVSTVVNEIDNLRDES